MTFETRDVAVVRTLSWDKGDFGRGCDNGVTSSANECGFPRGVLEDYVVLYVQSGDTASSRPLGSLGRRCLGRTARTGLQFVALDRTALSGHLR